MSLASALAFMLSALPAYLHLTKYGSKKHERPGSRRRGGHLARDQSTSMVGWPQGSWEDRGVEE